MIYFIGFCELFAFIIWAHAEPVAGSMIPLIPLLLLGVGLAIYITLVQAAIPYLVPTKIVGTAMGLQCSFQNLGLMTMTYFFSTIHDMTQSTNDGYYWSVVSFTALSFVGLILKINIGIWDKSRGSILDSKKPFEDFKKF